MSGRFLSISGVFSGCWVKIFVFKWFAKVLGIAPELRDGDPSAVTVDSILFLVLVVICDDVPYLVKEL